MYENFAFKFQAVAEKTAKNIRGLLYFAAPCSKVVRCQHYNTDDFSDEPDFIKSLCTRV